VLDLSDGGDIFVKVNIIISIDLFWTYIYIYISGVVVCYFTCVCYIIALCSVGLSMVQQPRT
jgi:hypothetical protein